MASPIAVSQASADLAEVREAVESEFDLLDSENAEVAEALDRLGGFIAAVGERFPAPEGIGEKIGLRDLNGKQLRKGDTVKVYKSVRYGDPTGTLMGTAPGVGSTGPRVRVRLDDGRDDNYTPSVGRVERLISTKGRKAEAVGAADVAD